MTAPALPVSVMLEPLRRFCLAGNVPRDLGARYDSLTAILRLDRASSADFVPPDTGPGLGNAEFARRVVVGAYELFAEIGSRTTLRLVGSCDTGTLEVAAELRLLGLDVDLHEELCEEPVYRGPVAGQVSDALRFGFFSDVPSILGQADAAKVDEQQRQYWLGESEALAGNHSAAWECLSSAAAGKSPDIAARAQADRFNVAMRLPDAKERAREVLDDGSLSRERVEDRQVALRLAAWHCNQEAFYALRFATGDALRWLNTGIELAERHTLHGELSVMLANRAELERRLGSDPTSRIGDLERAVLLRPSYQDWQAELAKAYVDAGRPEEASWVLDRADVAGLPSPKILLLRAQLCVAAGRCVEAVDHVTRAARMRWSDEPVQAGCHAALRVAGDSSAIRAHLLTWVSRSSSAAAAVRLARFAIKNGSTPTELHALRRFKPGINRDLDVLIAALEARADTGLAAARLVAAGFDQDADVEKLSDAVERIASGASGADGADR